MINTSQPGTLNVDDLQTALVNGDVTVNATQDLWVLNDLTWTSGNKLTLTAGQKLRQYASIESSTNNGSVEFKAADWIVVAAGTNVLLSTGSGNISFITDDLAFDGSLTQSQSFTTTVRTTGTLSIIPFTNNFNAGTLGGSDGTIGQGLEWSGTLSNGNFFAGNDFKKLIIENYANLGGLVVGKQESTTNVYIGNDISITGPITFYGGSVNLRTNLQTTADNGDILLHASGNISINDNRSITTSGGDVWLEGDVISTSTSAKHDVQTGSGDVRLTSDDVSGQGFNVTAAGFSWEPKGTTWTSVGTTLNISAGTLNSNTLTLTAGDLNWYRRRFRSVQFTDTE